MIPPKFIKHIFHLHILRKGLEAYKTPMPATPILNSNFDGSFIAGIAELRYLYSMPVERIVKYFKGHGFDLDKNTAHELLAKAANIFENIYKALRLAVKEGRILNCDETYHKVLVNPQENSGKGSRKGYVWAIVSAETGLVYFFYDDGSRSEDVILKELKDYEGVIQSDGLAAYKKVALRSS